MHANGVINYAGSTATRADGDDRTPLSTLTTQLTLSPAGAPAPEADLDDRLAAANAALAEGGEEDG